MINPASRLFAVDMDDDNGLGEFIKPLPTVIEAHMRTSPKLFRPCTLQEDFFTHCRVKISRQAMHSALVSLLRQGKIVKDGRAVYRHKIYSLQIAQP